MNRNKIIVLLVLFCAGASAWPVMCPAWTEDGVGVCTEGSEQTNVQIATDGHGGVVIGWEDYRHGNADIFTQRIDRFGNILWQQGGRPVCVHDTIQLFGGITSDGNGGAILVWEDKRVEGDPILLPGIYAQRVNAAGQTEWAWNGRPVYHGDLGRLYDPQVVSDGTGGAIVIWRNSFSTRIRGQRLNADGGLLWLSDPPIIGGLDLVVSQVKMVSDGRGVAIVLWRSGEEYVDHRLNAARIKNNNDLPWGSDGILICEAFILLHRWKIHDEPQAISDGNSGVFITWSDDRSGVGYGFDIFAQKLGYDGARWWYEYGNTICADAENQHHPRLTTDGAGGIFICWSHGGPGGYDIAVHRVGPDGVSVWPDGFKLVCDAAGNQFNSEIVSDGEGGAVIVWLDEAGVTPTIRAQHIDSNGDRLWQLSGVVVCADMGGPTSPVITAGMSGAVYTAWIDGRNGNDDVYAQWLDGGGRYATPAVAIESVTDIPGDQGGRLRVLVSSPRWDRGTEEFTPITSYNLWRRVGGSSPPSPMFGFPPGAWESVGVIPATQTPEFDVTVPTRADMWCNGPWEVFVVTAHTDVAHLYYVSTPDSGYSVNDMRPEAPAGLRGEQTFSPAGLLLTWEPSTDPGVVNYALYRGSEPDFVPSAGDLIATPNDESYFDDEWTWDSGLEYKLTALDIDGNKSDCVPLMWENVTGAGSVIPHADFLAHNHPNPFNPTTTIEFSLRAPAHVTLTVYDVNGRLVRVLVDEPRAAGLHKDVVWDGRNGAGERVATGIYLYRLLAGDFTDTKKMVLLK